MTEDKDNPWTVLAELGAMPDSEIDLMRGALALAMLDTPVSSLSTYQWHISDTIERARTLGERTREASDQAGVLSRVLFEEAGYDGDRATYDHRDNANLIRVIDRRRGLPVALGLLYLHVGERIGWSIHGLGVPGHFVIRLSAGEDHAVIDPFHGGNLVDAPRLRLLIKRTLGPSADLLPEHLMQVGKRDVLIRLQNNLKSRALAEGEVEQALNVLKRMTMIAPQDASLHLERGALESELGRLSAASESLSTCLRLSENDNLRARAEKALSALRRRLN